MQKDRTITIGGDGGTTGAGYSATFLAGREGLQARFSDDFDMTEFGKLLILFGVVLVIAGLALVLFGRTNLPIGRLPGDILYRGKNTTFYFPLATSILLSVVLSLVLYVISRFRR